MSVVHSLWPGERRNNVDIGCDTIEVAPVIIISIPTYLWLALGPNSKYLWSNLE